MQQYLEEINTLSEKYIHETVSKKRKGTERLNDDIIEFPFTGKNKNKYDLRKKYF